MIDAWNLIRKRSERCQRSPWSTRGIYQKRSIFWPIRIGESITHKHIHSPELMKTKAYIAAVRTRMCLFNDNVVGFASHYSLVDASLSLSLSLSTPYFCSPIDVTSLRLSPLSARLVLVRDFHCLKYPSPTFQITNPRVIACTVFYGSPVRARVGHFYLAC